MLQETEKAAKEAQGKLLNYITPHGKWSIHSTYSEIHRMMTLSRGGYPVWLYDKDAAELGIKDNDWVELFNDNGVFVQRAIVSARIPRGTVFLPPYSPELQPVERVWPLVNAAVALCTKPPLSLKSSTQSLSLMPSSAASLSLSQTG